MIISLKPIHGRSFVVGSDHKPHDAIVAKNLAHTSVRPHRMVMWIQGYDFRPTYNTGKEMLLADGLSLYNPELWKEFRPDVVVHLVNV